MKKPVLNRRLPSVSVRNRRLKDLPVLKKYANVRKKHVSVKKKPA